MLYTKDISKTKCFKKAKTEGIGKDVPGKWKQSESRGSDTGKRQSPAKAKKINCDKEGISLMLKVSIHYMAVINTYAPNTTLHYYLYEIKTTRVAGRHR